MSGSKGGIYQRGPYWLDFARGAGGRPISPRLYIFWYDADRGRQRRTSTGTVDVQLACDALDRHYLAAHRASEQDRASYTVAQALTDYYLAVGSKRDSATSIKARLLLFTRFLEAEATAGRLPSPFLPDHLDNHLLDRFRAWGVADPIVARRKNDAGEWVRDGARRTRSASTVEESVIQLKAAISHAKKRGRIHRLPELEHKTRNEVTAARNDRMTVAGIAELLDYAARGGAGSYVTPERLMSLKRYVIAAVATMGRPDAILDISVLPRRQQWLSEYRILDLNPAGRIQTRKYRAALPVGDVMVDWLEATQEWFVCTPRREHLNGEEVVRQIGVASVRSAWDTARAHLGIPDGWGPKLLRHSMSTILANRGVNPLEIKIALGHTPIGGSTERYVIFEPTYLRTFLDGVADVFADLNRIVPGALTPIAHTAGRS